MPSSVLLTLALLLLTGVYINVNGTIVGFSATFYEAYEEEAFFSEGSVWMYWYYTVSALGDIPAILYNDGNFQSSYGTEIPGQGTYKIPKNGLYSFTANVNLQQLNTAISSSFLLLAFSTRSFVPVLHSFTVYYLCYLPLLHWSVRNQFPYKAMLI